VGKVVDLETKWDQLLGFSCHELGAYFLTAHPWKRSFHQHLKELVDFSAIVKVYASPNLGGGGVVVIPISF
jgi:hypothetical protein